MTLLRSTFLSAALALGFAAPSVAEPPQGVVVAEFLPGWKTEQGTYMAGLHLRLAPGWKTYWRAPGDAGIPPRFDWAGSENLAGVRLHWPTPRMFASNGLRTIGYESDLVLPIELTPRDPGRPMDVHARMEIGVCHDICMPMELSMDGRLPSEGNTGPIRAALDARPLTAAEARVGGVRCTVEPIADGLRLTAEIDVPALGRHEAAVFELSDASVWVSEAEMAREGSRLVARSDLVPSTGQPFALDRSELRITLLGDGRAVDIRGCAGK